MPYTPYQPGKPAVWSAAHLHAPAANLPAIVTLAAVAAKVHIIRKIWWSYSLTPTAGAGRLTIEDVAGQFRFDLRISNSGPGEVDLADDPMISAAANTALIVTLAAGGAGCLGTLWVRPEGTDP